MKFYSLDMIVKNVLLNKGYSMHYYLQCLVYCKDILRELSMDDLKIINTVRLTLSDTASADLPDDYLDYCKVGVENGQVVRPLVPSDSINRLVNTDSSGNTITYTDTSNPVIIGFLPSVFWNTTTYNTYGENTGRMYGYTGSYSDTFKIIRERGQIQCNELIEATEIVLEHISDGTSCNAASQVDPYAMQTIKDYAKWQFKENRRDISEGEKERARQIYINSRKILRARKNELTIDVIRRIMHSAYHAAPKA